MEISETVYLIFRLFYSSMYIKNVCYLIVCLSEVQQCCQIYLYCCVLQYSCTIIKQVCSVTFYSTLK
jgi:hypothetical protein